MLRRRRIWTGLAGGLATMGLALPVAGEASAIGPALPQWIPSAASDDRLWILMETGAASQGGRLLHVSLDAGGPYFSSTPDGLVLPQSPQGLASWDDQLWIVSHPRQQQPDIWRREVFTVRVERNPYTGADHFVPYDQLRVGPALTGMGGVAGFVGTAAGPVVLLVPAQKDVAGVEAGGESAAAEPGLGKPKLLELHGDAWEELPLPDGFSSVGGARLSAGGLDRRVLWLFSAGDRPRTTNVHRRGLDGVWHKDELALALSDVRATLNVGPQVAVVLEGEPDAGEIEIAFVTGAQVLALSKFAAPTGHWSLQGLRDGPRLIERVKNQDLAMSRIHPLSGEIGPREMLVPQPQNVRQFLFLPLLLAVAMTLALAWVLFRPAEAAARVTLPPRMGTAPPGQRLAALALDLVPSGMVTMLILHCSFADLMRLPSFNATFSSALPSLLMTTITVTHGAIGELLAGRSLGKGLLGLYVASNSGTRPRTWQVVVRNLVKLATLWIPPMALVMFVIPHAKGIGDVLARTVVIRDLEEADSADSD